VQIVVVAVGKLKERFWSEAQAEYTKRLGAYCRISVEEVADEPDVGSIQKVTELEGQRILQRLRDRDFVIVLAITGERMRSELLAERLERLQADGHGRFVFIIGGSCGLHPSVVQRADWQLSMSDLTFPHALARIMMLEQVYRAFRIQRGEPYHK